MILNSQIYIPNLSKAQKEELIAVIVNNAKGTVSYDEKGIKMYYSLPNLGSRVFKGNEDILALSRFANVDILALDPLLTKLDGIADIKARYAIINDVSVFRDLKKSANGGFAELQLALSDALSFSNMLPIGFLDYHDPIAAVLVDKNIYRYVGSKKSTSTGIFNLVMKKLSDIGLDFVSLNDANRGILDLASYQVDKHSGKLSEEGASNLICDILNLAVTKNASGSNYRQFVLEAHAFLHMKGIGGVTNEFTPLNSHKMLPSVESKLMKGYRLAKIGDLTGALSIFNNIQLYDVSPTRVYGPHKDKYSNIRHKKINLIKTEYNIHHDRAFSVASRGSYSPSITGPNSSYLNDLKKEFALMLKFAINASPNQSEDVVVMGELSKFCDPGLFSNNLERRGSCRSIIDVNVKSLQFKIAENNESITSFKKTDQFFKRTNEAVNVKLKCLKESHPGLFANVMSEWNNLFPKGALPFGADIEQCSLKINELVNAIPNKVQQYAVDYLELKYSPARAMMLTTAIPEFKKIVDFAESPKILSGDGVNDDMKYEFAGKIAGYCASIDVFIANEMNCRNNLSQPMTPELLTDPKTTLKSEIKEQSLNSGKLVAELTKLNNHKQINKVGLSIDDDNSIMILELISKIDNLYDRVTKNTMQDDKVVMQDEFDWINKLWNKITENLTKGRFSNDDLNNAIANIEFEFNDVLKTDNKSNLSKWFNISSKFDSLSDEYDQIKESSIQLISDSPGVRTEKINDMFSLIEQGHVNLRGRFSVSSSEKSISKLINSAKHLMSHISSMEVDEVSLYIDSLYNAFERRDNLFNRFISIEMANPDKYDIIDMNWGWTQSATSFSLDPIEINTSIDKALAIIDDNTSLQGMLDGVVPVDYDKKMINYVKLCSIKSDRGNPLTLDVKNEDDGSVLPIIDFDNYVPRSSMPAF